MERSSADTVQLRSLNPRATVERQIMVHQTLLQVVHGDLTEEKTDAITNAANESLWLGGGVAGAIDRKGGPTIERECLAYVRSNGELDIGDVAVTGAGNMPCKFVIHAVGPIYSPMRRNNNELLEKAVLNTFRAAEERKLSSVSIPGISSGIFGFPKNECAKVMYGAFVKYLETHPTTSLRIVRYINFDTPTVNCFEQEFDRAKTALEAAHQRLEHPEESKAAAMEETKEVVSVSSEGTIPVNSSPELTGFHPEPSPQLLPSQPPSKVLYELSQPSPKD